MFLNWLSKRQNLHYAFQKHSWGRCFKGQIILFCKSNRMEFLHWTPVKLQVYYEITLHYTGIYLAYSKPGKNKKALWCFKNGYVKKEKYRAARYY